MKKKITLKDISKNFSDRAILSSVNIDFESGGANFILAPNGYGKTTLINMILGFTKFKGELEKKNIKHCKQFAIFDDKNFYSNLTGLDNLMIFSGQSDRETIYKISGKYFSNSLLKKKLKVYSLGETKKLSLILWELTNPDLVLLDEISNGLDFDSLRNLSSLIKRQSENNLIILTGHHFEFYEKFVDNVYAIVQNKIVKVENWKEKGLVVIYDEFYE